MVSGQTVFQASKVPLFITTSEIPSKERITELSEKSRQCSMAVQSDDDNSCSDAELLPFGLDGSFVNQSPLDIAKFIIRELQDDSNRIVTLIFAVFDDESVKEPHHVQINSIKGETMDDLSGNSAEIEFTFRSDIREVIEISIQGQDDTFGIDESYSVALGHNNFLSYNGVYK